MAIYLNGQLISGGGQTEIGSIVKMINTENYVPEGLLYCDGSEYTKAQFPDLWDNYLFSGSPTISPNWTSVQIDAGKAWSDICCADGKFVAVGATVAATSTDGITWEVVSSLPSLYGVCYGDGKFVAVGRDGLITYSVDGKNWATPFAVGDKYWLSVTYNNGKFVAVGKNLCSTSADGITWEIPTTVIEDGTTNIDCQRVIFANNKFVCVTYTSKITTSTDGITWEAPITIDTSGNALVDITYADGKFVAVGNGGIIVTSADGITWDNITVGSENWRGITYDGERFITVGNNGYITTSTDGITWEAPIQILSQEASQPYQHNFDCVCYGGGMLVMPRICEFVYNKYLGVGLLAKNTYAEYEAELTTYGQCDKIAVDIDNQLFRVPKILNDGDKKHYIVVANGTINESLMDWSAWQSSLEGKANKTDIPDTSNLATKTELTEGLATKQPTGNYIVNSAEDEESIAIGTNSSSFGIDAIAIGEDSFAQAYGIGIGKNAGASNIGAISIGSESRAIGSNGVAIGADSNAIGLTSIAIGTSAHANLNNTIQLGVGDNNTENSLQVDNYMLLDLSTGKIPDQRLSENIATKEDLQNNGLNYDQITNCLLEVPQNVKLELNDGVLTLKAGSVVIIPNGFEVDGVTPKFDHLIIDTDCEVTQGGTDRYISLSYNKFVGALERHIPENMLFSGTNTPTTFQYALWYDTKNNIIKKTIDNGATWVVDQEISFPIAFVTETDSVGYTEINQVFNGMGYIGSTVWVDKGVKGLVANGRNANGTYNNLQKTRSAIAIRTLSGTNDVSVFMNFDSNALDYVERHTVEYTSNPTATCKRYYNEDENYWYSHETKSIVPYINIINLTLTNDKISNFEAMEPFKAVDYNKVKDLLDVRKQKVHKCPDTSGVINVGGDPGRNLYHVEVTGMTIIELANQPGFSTFELALKMTTAQSIIFPSTIKWLDDEAPDLSESGIYYLVFRYDSILGNWYANLQGRWSL